MERFGEYFTRDIAGAFSEAQSPTSGNGSFEQSKGYAGLSEGSSPIQLRALQARSSAPDGAQRAFKGKKNNDEVRSKKRIAILRKKLCHTKSINGLEAIQASAVSIAVKELQGLLLKQGASRDGLVSSRTGQPDGIWGAKTAAQNTIIAQRLGFPQIGAVPNSRKDVVSITPADYIVKLKLESMPKTALPTGSNVIVPTVNLQEHLLRIGAKKNGLVGKSGKPDGAYGSKTEAAFKLFATKNDLAVAGVKKVGTGSVSIDPKGTYEALQRQSEASIKGREVSVAALQKMLLISRVVPSSKAMTDGKWGSTTLAALRKWANKNDYYFYGAQKTSGGTSVVVKPIALLNALEASTKNQVALDVSKSSEIADERTYSALKESSKVQRALNERWQKSMKFKKLKVDNNFGKASKAAFAQVAKHLGYTTPGVATANKGKTVRFSPPELMDKIMLGESGRQTSTVEESSASVLKTDQAAAQATAAGEAIPTKQNQTTSPVQDSDEVVLTDREDLDKSEAIVTQDTKASEANSMTTSTSDSSGEPEASEGFFAKNKKAILGGVVVLGVIGLFMKKKNPALAGLDEGEDCGCNG